MLGAAQDDRVSGQGRLLVPDASGSGADPSVAIPSRNAADNEISSIRPVVTHTYSPAIAEPNASAIAFVSAIAVNHRERCTFIKSI